jgi:hypothetical protein
MKATQKFMKDLVLVGIGFGIMVLFLSVSGGVKSSVDLFMCFLCSGVLFGWKCVNNVFIAFSWWSLLIKALASVVVGFFAMPITLIVDIIHVIREFRAARA